MSFPTAADLAGYPGLITWLRERTWRDYFKQRIIEQGQSLQVTSIQIGKSKPGDVNPIILNGLVKNPSGWSEDAEIYLFPPALAIGGRYGYEFATDCSCVGTYACEHAVAMLETLRAIAVATNQVTESQVSHVLATWLRQIKEARGYSAVASKPSKPYNKFLAYCIEREVSYRADAKPVFQFALRVGTTNKSGFSIDRGYAAVDNYRTPKYVAPEDLPICARYRICCSGKSIWGQPGLVSMDGTDWDSVITPALATGRLFLGVPHPDRPSDKVYTRLTEGGELEAEARWEMLESGAAHPVVKLPDPSACLILSDPPYYIDPETSRLGRVTSTLKPAMLRAWMNGPTVPSSAISQLRVELAAVTPDDPLPLPSEPPAKYLNGLSPTPWLHITEVFTGVFLKRHIGAILKFQYPDCPKLPPLAPHAAPRSVWFDGESRVILNRDATAEAGFLADLDACDLLPVLRFFPEHEVTEKYRHSFVYGSTKATSTDWLGFISSDDWQRLEAKGWQLETDPKLGLTIHDVRDFFPAIETTNDHGIDWFRFDVTAEFNGKRVSLIPHIARAIAEDWQLSKDDSAALPDTVLLACDNPADGHIRFPAQRFLEMVDQVRHLFHGGNPTGPLRLDRLGAAGVAAALSIDSSETSRSLANLGRNLRNIHELPPAAVPAAIKADLRPYQADGFRWLQFLASHGLHGILADDMGLGKTLQTLAHLAAEHAKSPGQPSLVIAPTSVVPNWAAEVEKFAPDLKVLVLHGSDRADRFDQIAAADVVLTSYPLLVRDFDELFKQHWHVVVLDEAQYIKNPKALTAVSACRLKSSHRICLSGTPMENHLGELWSLLRFLMPGFLADEKTFNAQLRKPIERDHSSDAQLALNRRVAPLILRRTKDQVATELPAKTTLIHGIDLTSRQADLYESVRAVMDQRVRDAIATKGIAQSHIIVLDALLKLRQICCHPQLLKSEVAQRVTESAKLTYLTTELLPTLIEEGRRILLFSQFTSMLALIEEHLQLEDIPYLKLTGQTKERANLVSQFQAGAFPVFLISLKAGGTGLNLTAADTVVHYDPWWNPAAENQATDRAHRIGQTKPVFVHKLVCRGTIEDRILELQDKKAALVEALLSEDTSKLRIDAETLTHLLSPLS